MTSDITIPAHGRAATALALIMALGLAAPAAADEPTHDHGQEAAVPGDAAVPLFEGMGDHRFPVTTASDAAQAWVDQGLMLVFGFNHFEAVRSFEAAAREDEACAMCYWGIALALGPHINAPMMPEHVAPALAALERAQALAPEASERERAYIEALAHRYVADPPEDRSALDRAYADAMGALAAAHPDDLDARTLYAEALMNLVPWNYWDENGAPRPETALLVDALEAVLEREPSHPGATHLYIHAMENSPDPGRAEDAADRLAALNIQIGHMIHMPSHIYARIGRWHDASAANEAAIAADEAYLAAYDVEGLVPVLYHPHNVHFLVWTAGMEGRSALASAAAGDLAETTPEEIARALPSMNNFIIARLLSHLRFEEWDAVLDLPEPAAEDTFLRGMWHYARGMALIEEDRRDEARAEAAALAEIAGSDEAAKLEMPEAFLPGETMLRVAEATLDGIMTLRAGDTDAGLERLEEAVALQDGLPYFEPPYWFVSARLHLGRALLEAGRPEEAADVYRADLEVYPHNPWALRGLVLSLKAEDDEDALREAEAAFEAAWRDADVAFAEGAVTLEPRN